MQDEGSQQEIFGFYKILVQCHHFHVTMPNLREDNFYLPSLAQPQQLQIPENLAAES